MATVQRDLSLEKRATAQLIASHERYEAQFRSLPLPAYVWRRIDDDFVLIEWNDRRYFEQRLKAALGTDRVAIVIVEIAAQAGMQTVAEGVEDAGALALLREYGVDYAQGFHIHRPGPLPED